MSNLDNPLFKSVCELLGIDEKTVQKYLENPMSNMTRDMVCDDKDTEDIAKNPDDLPNRMNPEGKSVNQLKAEGWNLVENVEKAGDGTYICKRVWTKSDSSDDDKCCCQKETPDISDARLKSDMLTVDGWMDTMNWALLSNWDLMKEAMYSKLPGARNEIDSILKFVRFALETAGEADTYQVSDFWDGLPSKNAYSTAEILDHIIQDIVESVKDNESVIVAGMNKLCPEARNTLINRLKKYKGFLETELEVVTDSVDVIEPQYHHTNIMKPYFESSLYSMIYLWYSLITEYLAELIEITNEIISANKVL